MREPGRPWNSSRPCSRSTAWTRPGDHFRYAQVWSSAGASEKAIEAAVRYLQIRGREADRYDDAIDLINRAEARQAGASPDRPHPVGAAPDRPGSGWGRRWSSTG